MSIFPSNPSILIIFTGIIIFNRTEKTFVDTI